MVVELIADGVHLAPETVSMVFDAVGPDQIALVSDSMAAAGMDDGDYQLGALDVTVQAGVARLATTDGSVGAIAGGTARLLDVLRSTVFDGGVALEIYFWPGEEEMAELVKYQRAFQASSRVFNVIDDLLDTVVNRLGNF